LISGRHPDPLELDHLLLKRFDSDATRLARRMARIARWDRPIDGPASRARAWAHMLLADHGVFRLAYLNRHRVTNTLWRSAQPAPHQLAWFAAQGVRTIVNLRGGREHGSWPLQREACERHGIKLVEFLVHSRGAPQRETVLGAKAFFAGLEYPALIHCKSGADRAGFAAALYLIVHEGRPVTEALRQLSPRFGHVRLAKTGILDSFFERYLVEGEANGIPFLEWAERIYDPEALARDFRPGFFSELVVDRIMRRE
jgi:protein tyrosine/serine phosphatase